MAKQYGRVHRLLRIITLIQSGRWNAKQLAAECGTTIRTIYRDLKMLEGAGVPYYYDSDSGVYHIRREFFMPPVDLTLQESLALVSLAGQVGGREQIAFMKPLEQVAQKILARLPKRLKDELDVVSPRIEIDLARCGPAQEVSDVYGLVQAAICKQRALECSYDSIRSTTQRDDASVFLFEPYSLLWGQRAWYAVGYHRGHDEVRTLKLNRFTSIKPTGSPYVIPSNFSVRQHLGKAWRMIRGGRTYRIELHFDAKFAETVADTHWHDTQEIEWLDDGSILFRCEVDGLDEIVWWILSMGPHCRVRKPAVLARRVRDLAAQTAGQYAVPGSNAQRSTAGIQASVTGVDARH